MSWTSIEVRVVRCGAQTPVGLTATESAASVRAGISRIGEHPFLVGRAGERVQVARATHLSDELLGVDRWIELAIPAASEALLDLHRSAASMPSMPLVLGLPAERPGLPATFAEDIAAGLGRNGDLPCSFSEIVTLTCGHAAGLMAFEEGVRRISGGTSELCLVGGVDSYLQPQTLEWLDAERRLHSEIQRWGFVPGEAAGFCLLASESAVTTYGLDAPGRVLATATAREANVIGTDTVCVGEGLTDAFRHVLDVLDPSNQTVDQIICDLNGERYRVDEYGFASARTSEFLADASDFLAPADCWGDVGAASGPLFIMLAQAAARKGYAAGPRTLVWTSSESGERSAILLSHPQTEKVQPQWA